MPIVRARGRIMHNRLFTGLGALALAATLGAQEAPKTTPTQEAKPAQEAKATEPQGAAKAGQEQKKEPTKKNKDEVLKALKPRLEEGVVLREKSNAITKKIGEITSSTNLSTNDEAIATLKTLVQELTQINEQLKKLQEEVDEIKGWIEGQNESLPVLVGDVETLKKFKNGTYLQFQFTDSQNNAGTPRPNDGFNMRRTRFSHNGTIDSRTSYKLAVDFSSGSQRLGAELKDAILIYDIEPSVEKVGIQLLAGQQPIPLGYELERSSSEREFPERSQYNQRLVPGERGRGVITKYGISNNVYVHGGLWNSLTYNDPQQLEVNTFRNLSGTKLAAHAGVRHQTTTTDVGLSFFTGYRNPLTYTAGNNTFTTNGGQRQFIYLDGTWVINPMFTLRGELMTAYDRLPQFSGSGANRRTSARFSHMRGNQLQLSWNINSRNTLSARYEFFDPNVNNNDNVFAWGLSWNYMINPGVRLTLAHEFFQEQGSNVPNNPTTIRLQFRF